MADDKKDMSAQEAFISELPPNLRTQLLNGIPDVGNVPMEALRRMAVEAGADGAIGDLEGVANRGGFDPRQWVNATDISGADKDKDGQLIPPSTPQAKQRGGGGPGLPD